MTDLGRFRSAQEGVYEAALAELRAGVKQGHWMWFVFPQLVGFGRSAIARAYGIADLSEARAYMADPVLGLRYRACCSAVAAHAGTAPERILGPVDALKLRSSVTLMARAAEVPEARAVLAGFYGGVECPATRDLLET